MNTSRLEKYDELPSVSANPTKFTLNSLEFAGLSGSRATGDGGASAACVSRTVAPAAGFGELAARIIAGGGATGVATARAVRTRLPEFPEPLTLGGGGTTDPCSAASAIPAEVANSPDGIRGAGPTA